ncbi:predicted protein [Plenodomus lingam JN3]|uniref:Uncharacterized protein n=1 Tax=Leptosphaeria maculans (strain JN3 / isolate v23.1.3 / race Av1-4-5-6-7-8) TaxID=985895 RepID=E4ZFV2_LEPMJ|nr:predicted protein [Plenodomus lingam JN3]CBX90172.1 predicted protein [Plenodomus lingam JN3]
MYNILMLILLDDVGNSTPSHDPSIHPTDMFLQYNTLQSWNPINPTLHYRYSRLHASHPIPVHHTK